MPEGFLIRRFFADPPASAGHSPVDSEILVSECRAGVFRSAADVRDVSWCRSGFVTGTKVVSILVVLSIRKVNLSKQIAPQNDNRREYAKPEGFQICCSWCGALIRTSITRTSEQMCLICHARMLNDYFQRIRKLSGEKRTSRRM